MYYNLIHLGGYLQGIKEANKGRGREKEGGEEEDEDDEEE